MRMNHIRGREKEGGKTHSLLLVAFSNNFQVCFPEHKHHVHMGRGSVVCAVAEFSGSMVQ